MNTNIYLVRHAESLFVKGQEESRELTDKGLNDSICITDILLNESIDHITSSPYKRAIQTVIGIANSLQKEVVLDDRFKERTLASDDYVFKDHQSAVEYAFKYPSKHFPGGESNNEAQTRGIDALKEFVKCHQGENIVIGTHGNSMVCIMNYFSDHFDYQFWKSTTMLDLYKLTIDQEFKLIQWKRLWK